MPKFKKGDPGGPGRPKGSKGIKQQLEEALQLKITRLSLLEKDEIDLPRPKEMTVGEHMIERLLAKAIGKGEDLSTIDLKAIDMIYDRIEGKAVARSAVKDAQTWDDLLRAVENEE